MLPKDHLSYFSQTWLWLILLLVGTYLLLIIFYQPEAKEVDNQLKQELAKTAPMNKGEKFSLVVLIVSLFFWIVGPFIGVPSYSVGLIALCVFLIQGTLTTQDFKSRISWDMIILIGGFLSTATLLNTLHISDWLVVVLEPVLAPLVGNIYVLVPVLSLLIVLLRTVVVSEVACMTIMYSVFAKSVQSAGVNPFIILFITLIISQTWHMSYNNIGIDATQAATEESLVAYKDIRLMSVAYIALCIIIFMLSIPLWYHIGLLT